MSLVLGLISGGAAYNRKLSMTDSVREGSRFGATLAGPTSPTAWATLVQTRTAGLSAGELSPAQVCVKLYKVGTGDVYTSGCTSTEPAAPTTASTGDCVVKVWAARPTSMQAMFFSTTITLTASSVSRYESKVSSGAILCS